MKITAEFSGCNKKECQENIDIQKKTLNMVTGNILSTGKPHTLGQILTLKVPKKWPKISLFRNTTTPVFIEHRGTVYTIWPPIC